MVLVPLAIGVRRKTSPHGEITPSVGASKYFNSPWMETPRSLASSALTHPPWLQRATGRTELRSSAENEAWFLVNSTADKRPERRHCAVATVSRTERLSRSKTVLFPTAASHPKVAQNQHRVSIFPHC